MKIVNKKSDYGLIMSLHFKILGSYAITSISIKDNSDIRLKPQSNGSTMILTKINILLKYLSLMLNSACGTESSYCKDTVQQNQIQLEPLMADGVSWRCFSYFSEPRQCYLSLAVNGTVRSLPGFDLKYLQLCSEDERSFYGVGTTCG